MPGQVLGNAGQHRAGTVIRLLRSGHGQMVSQPIQVLEEDAAHFFVRGRAGEEVQRLSLIHI